MADGTPPVLPEIVRDLFARYPEWRVIAFQGELKFRGSAAACELVASAAPLAVSSVVALLTSTLARDMLVEAAAVLAAAPSAQEIDDAVVAPNPRVSWPILACRTADAVALFVAAGKFVSGKWVDDLVPEAQRRWLEQALRWRGLRRVWLSRACVPEVARWCD